MDVGLLAQYIMNGLMLGMMYALVAVGFTLFFGVLDIIKFSHGDVLTVGAFTALATYVGLRSAGIGSFSTLGAEQAADFGLSHEVLPLLATPRVVLQCRLIGVHPVVLSERRAVLLIARGPELLLTHVSRGREVSPPEDARLWASCWSI